MNAVARDELLRALEDLQRHGSSMSLLAMTVRTTSNGLLAGVADGAFSLNYPHAGWLDVVRVRRFASFCRTQRLPLQRKKWGNERVSSATVGRVVLDAVGIIDQCFSAVYGEKGPFGLELRQYGWRS